MKGKLDEDGCLWIERRGKFVKQYCADTAHLVEEKEETVMVPCGDWCASFGEPQFVEEQKKMRLVICTGIWMFDSFEWKEVEEDGRSD